MNAPSSNHYATCGICQRRADGIGYSANGKLPVVWVCADCGPERARKASRMRDFDIYEKKAFDSGARKAGEFRDTIGKTDLAVLSLEEYEAFLMAFHVTFVEEIRRMVEGGEAPF